MILRTVFGAVFGAAFGYILGLLVEWLFPHFNAALLAGITAITGIGGIQTAALLAAVGFFAGVLGGVLSGLAHYTFKHAWRSRWQRWWHWD